jgi:tetratricopeptide (TPR) repeat protein
MLLTGNDLVDRALESGDPALAEEAIREVDLQLTSVSETKDMASLLLAKALLNGFLHRYSDARRQLAQALEQAPTDPDVRFSHDVIDASLYDQEGKPEQAYIRLTAVLSRYSERLSRSDARSIYEDIQQRRAFDLFWLKRFEDAVPLLKECLSFDLKAIERSCALANLGICYVKLKQYEEAKDWLLKAREMGVTKEWEGHVHFYLAFTYAQLHLLRESKREFQVCEERAVQYQLPLEQLYKWLSRICGLLGEKVEAERYARLARPC